MARFRDREDRDQRLSSPSLGSLAIRSIPDRIVPALLLTQGANYAPRMGGEDPPKPPLLTQGANYTQYGL